MRHIIHKFVNVYPLITYSCEVSIHIIWAEYWEVVQDDMESGIVTTYKDKGIITPELISLPFFLRSSNICLKNCFSDKFFLRAFIFPHAKFLKTRNLHLLWLQTKLCLILTTP